MGENPLVRENFFHGKEAGQLVIIEGPELTTIVNWIV